MRPAALPLMRPKQGRWLCGVCRGISLHLQVSVALVRLLFTAAAFIFGAGIVVYVFLWLTMPVGDPVAAAAARLNAVRESPLSRGNAGYGTESEDDADAEAAGERDSSSESLAAALARAPKPALVAMAGLVLLTVSALMAATGIDSLYILPVMLGLGGLAVAWLWFNQEDGQFKAMLGGIALIVLAYMVFVGNAAGYDGASPRVLIAGGLATMVGVMLAIVPWVNSLVRGLSTERALKEREVERKLFPGYVLVKMVMTDDSWYIVRNTRGVTGFVGPSSKPIPLTDEEVDKLGVDVREVSLDYAVGDNVQIMNGPLEGFIGIVEGIDTDAKKVNVKVSMFGRETPAELDFTQVKPL